MRGGRADSEVIEVPQALKISGIRDFQEKETSTKVLRKSVLVIFKVNVIKPRMRGMVVADEVRKA